ncbi:MAG TPA: hypothetical protein VNG13_10460 [Mycobacteriales bacterium]|nr:hypothetical protein [Mycobacteriales bacterium]
MSLTRDLATPDSPLSWWLGVRLPHADRLRADYLARLHPAPTVCGWPCHADPVPWGTLGTAIDLRHRFALSDDLSLEPARIGAWILERACAEIGWPDPGCEELFDVVAALVEQWRPDDRTRPVLLPGTVEERLDRCCVALAWLEAVYRRGLPRVDERADEVGPLSLAEPVPPLEVLLAGVHPGYLADLQALLGRHADGWFAAMRTYSASTDVQIGVTFVGSDLVGGADADWYCRGCLVDCKATMHPRRLPDTGLYQPVCYALLDFDDRYEVDAVGLYLARQDQLVTWRLDDALATLAGARVGAEELRAELADVLLDAAA